MKETKKTATKSQDYPQGQQGKSEQLKPTLSKTLLGGEKKENSSGTAAKQGPSRRTNHGRKQGRSSNKSLYGLGATPLREMKQTQRSRPRTPSPKAVALVVSRWKQDPQKGAIKTYLKKQEIKGKGGEPEP